MNSKKVKAQMKLKEFTYETLAEKLGISRSALIGYIQREKAPSHLLGEICKELNVSSDYVLDLSDQPNKQ